MQFVKMWNALLNLTLNRNLLHWRPHSGPETNFRIGYKYIYIRVHKYLVRYDSRLCFFSI